MRLYLQISGSQSSSGHSDALAARLRESFDAAMQDDLNTPEAIATLFEVAGRAGREISTRTEAANEFASLAETIEEVMIIFGFDVAQESSTEVEGVQIRYSEVPGAEVLHCVATREKARREKDWATADRLRDELHADGWAVEDTSEGPILSRR
jgi:cysteinyl-tRNA synthetase